MSFLSNILVVDDDESIRAGCIQTLKEEGYRIQAAENGRLALEKIKNESFDVILLDLMMPGIPGMEVLNKLKENNPDTLVIVITGFATIETAVESMKQGAYDFLTKPFEPETLVSVVKRAVENRFQEIEKTVIRHAIDERMISDTIIGCSEGMKKVVLLVKKVAPTDSTVLITGETGVGKELVAQTIHRFSNRHDKLFVTVDCGVLVESLFESEIFGHLKGAFTGAIETTQGKFELADGGTIFLDEIANISINMQARLLRVIQEQEISKVGSTKNINVDVRILSATNKDLIKEINAGRFREDLFYRFNVFPIHIPPLRERREDILLLARYFLKIYCEDKRISKLRISDKTLQYLELYPWPGNVRELKNAVERAVVTCDDTVLKIGDFSLPEASDIDNYTINENGTLAKLEKKEIIKTLQQFNGNKTKAAQSLGINRKTLREKIQKYGIKETL